MTATETQHTDTDYLAAKKPLILLPASPSIDAVCAAYALAHHCHAIGGTPTITTAAETSTLVPFLTAPPQIDQSISGLQDFIIQFSTAHNPIRDIAVDHGEGAITVTVTPERDYIDPRDFSFAPSQMHYDAVITVGTATIADTDLETEDNAIILKELPHTALTQTTAIDVVSFTLYNTLSTDEVSPDVAQCLLTGIVAATDGLRSEHVSAEIFRAASALIRAGADLQTIMLALYKTVSFDFLRLWGGILDNLTLSDDGHTASAIITPVYADDAMLLSLMLERTAQFLPHVQLLSVFWSVAQDNLTHGMLYVADAQLAQHLPAHFLSATKAPHNCLTITTDAAPHHILEQITTTNHASLETQAN